MGLLIGLGPLMGFAAVGPGGTIIDKYGARVVMLDIVGAPTVVHLCP